MATEADPKGPAKVTRKRARVELLGWFRWLVTRHQDDVGVGGVRNAGVWNWGWGFYICIYIYIYIENEVVVSNLFYFHPYLGK